MGVVHRWRSWWGEEASKIFMGSGLGFGRVTGVKGWRGNKKREKDGFVGRLIASIWPSYRYGSHKNQRSVSDEKLSEVCQTGGIRKFEYFKWWMMSDENWARSDERWTKKKKKKKPNNPLVTLRATASASIKFSSILQEKTYFFYFTHSLLQNIHIILSILHIYSIK